MRISIRVAAVLLAVTAVSLAGPQQNKAPKNDPSALLPRDSTVIDPTVDSSMPLGMLKLTHPVTLHLKMEGEIVIPAGKYLEVMAVFWTWLTIDYNTHILNVPVRFTSDEKRTRFFSDIRPMFRFLPARKIRTTTAHVLTNGGG
jgi:hypothetical protein